MLEAISYLKHMEKRSKRDWGAIYVYMALATCVSLGTPKAFFEFRFQKNYKKKTLENCVETLV